MHVWQDQMPVKLEGHSASGSGSHLKSVLLKLQISEELYLQCNRHPIHGHLDSKFMHNVTLVVGTCMDRIAIILTNISWSKFHLTIWTTASSFIHLHSMVLGTFKHPHLYFPFQILCVWKWDILFHCYRSYNFFFLSTCDCCLPWTWPGPDREWRNQCLYK